MTKADHLAIAMAGAFLVLFFLGQVSSFAADCEEVRQGTLRLHILANSDSEEDQALKLKVRDTLLEEYGSKLGTEDSLAGAEQEVLSLADEIEARAASRIRELGYSYPVKVSLENTYFETREYEKGVVLPAGRYDALRVVIGSGEGKNWWCVMYPPLCIPAATEDGAKSMEEKIRSLSETPVYEPKFLLVELFEGIKNR